MRNRAFHVLGVGFWAVLPLTAIALVLRALVLDADPAYPLWAGYVTDEGRWTEFARELVLVGSPNSNELTTIHLVLAPAYQGLAALLFALFGPSMVVARALSALFGVLLVVFVYLALQKRLTAEASVLGAVLIAVQPDLVFLSRSAIPEMPALFFETVAFALLVLGSGAAGAFLAGIALAAALGMKATVAPVILAFFAIAWAATGSGEETVRTRGARVGSFALGVSVPGFVVLALASIVIAVPDVSRLTDVVLDFLEPGSVYGAMARLWYSPEAPGLFVLLAPAWVLASIIFAAGLEIPDRLRAIYFGSAIWAGTWLLVAAILAYFPARYVSHVFVPLAIHVAAGVSILQHVGERSEIMESLRQVAGMRHLVARICISIGPAVLVTSVLLLGPLSLWVATNSLSVQVLVVAGATLVLVVAGVNARPSRNVFIVGLLPVVFTPVWLTLRLLSDVHSGFWDSDGIGVGVRLAALLISTLICAAVYRDLEHRRRRAWEYSIAGAVLICTPWLGEVGPRIASPTFTLRTAAASIEAATDAVVGSVESEGVFLYTNLRFTRDLEDGEPPNVVVTAFHPLPEDIRDRYSIVSEHPIHLGAAYMAREEPIEPKIWVYRRSERP